MRKLPILNNNNNQIRLNTKTHIPKGNWIKISWKGLLRRFAEYSGDVLDGTWAWEVMKSIVVRIEAEVINIGVVSDVGGDVLRGVDANELWVMTAALGFIAVSTLLE